MNSLPHFSYFDIIVVLLMLFFLVRGLWVGFMRQLAAFFGLIGGYLLAARYHGFVAPFAERYIENPKVIFLVCFCCVFLLAAIAFGLLGKLLRKVMEISLLGWFDRALGGALGVVKGFIVASLVYMFVASSLSATNGMLRKSLSAPYLQLGAEQLQILINDPRLKEYLRIKEPAIQDTK
ncbi:CvpA family protein [Desulfogranum japonicum]|uniref:CvpA family protein n=1 Tax=Desulfogranum japonicum TaxID=231447 RepID=UPI00041A8DA9|nr:CvpA family protein [Desulfogranum japonicum]